MAEKIIAILKPVEKVEVALKEPPKLTGRIELKNVILTGEEYTGAYSVTPSFSTQTLPTNNKQLREDIVVTEIPTYEVSNETGTTFIIGQIGE